MAALGVRPAIGAALPRNSRGQRASSSGWGLRGPGGRSSKAVHNQDFRSSAGPSTAAQTKALSAGLLDSVMVPTTWEKLLHTLRTRLILHVGWTRGYSKELMENQLHLPDGQVHDQDTSFTAWSWGSEASSPGTWASQTSLR